MNQRDHDDFTKKPLFDFGGRHKHKRIALTERWATDGDREAIAVLTTVVRDADDSLEVRQAATSALTTLSGVNTLPVLADLLHNKAHNAIHPAVVQSLLTLHTPKALATLVECWPCLAPTTAAQVEPGLATFDPAVLVPHLLTLVNHPTPAIRTSVERLLGNLQQIDAQEIEAIGRRGNAEDIDRLISLWAILPASAAASIAATLTHVAPEQCVPKLFDALLHPAATVREQTAAFLAQHAPLATLLPALAHPQEEVRRRAADLVAAQGKAAIPPLTERLTGTEHQLHATSLNILERIGTLPPETLVMALRSPDTAVKQRAADLLRGQGEAAVPAVKTVFDHLDHGLYGIALAILADAHAVTPAIALTALRSSNTAVQQQATACLTQLGAEATPPLVAALADPDANVRKRAQAILVEQGESVLPALLDRLGVAAGDEAITVQDTLHRLGKPAMDAQLVRLATTQGTTQDAVAAALGSFGPDALTALVAWDRDLPPAAAALRQTLAAQHPDRLVELVKEQESIDVATDLLVALGEAAVMQVVVLLDEENKEWLRRAAHILTTGLHLSLADTAMYLYKQNIPQAWQQNLDSRVKELGEEDSASLWGYRLVGLDPAFVLGHYTLGWAAYHRDLPGAAYNAFQFVINPVISHRDGMEERLGSSFLGAGLAAQDLASGSDEEIDRIGEDRTTLREQAVAYLDQAVTREVTDPLMHRHLLRAVDGLMRHYLEQDLHLDRVLPLARRVVQHADDFVVAAMMTGIDGANEIAEGITGLRAMLTEELPDVDAAADAFVQRLRGDHHFVKAKEFAIYSAMTSGPFREAALRSAVEGGFNPAGVDLIAETSTALYQEHLEKAETAFLAAIKLKPDYGAVYHILHDVYLRQDRQRDAVNILQQGIRATPTYWQLYFALGDLQKDELEQPRAAVDTYRKGLALKPDWANGHAVLAAVHLYLENYSTAVAEFQIALRLAPENIDWQQPLAFCQLMLGETGDILRGTELMTQVVRRDADALEMYIKVWLAGRGVPYLETLIAQGNWLQALRMVEPLAQPLKAVDTRQVDHELLANAYVWLIEPIGRIMEGLDVVEIYDLAIDLMKRATQLVPHNHDFRQVLVTATYQKSLHFLRAERLQDALYWSEKALEIGPDSNDAWTVSAIVHLQMGNRNKARQAAEKGAWLGNERAMEILTDLRGY